VSKLSTTTMMLFCCSTFDVLPNTPKLHITLSFKPDPEVDVQVLVSNQCLEFLPLNIVYNQSLRSISWWLAESTILQKTLLISAFFRQTADRETETDSKCAVVHGGVVGRVESTAGGTGWTRAVAAVQCNTTAEYECTQRVEVS